VTKPQLVEAVAEKHEQSRRLVEEIINAALDEITACLKHGDEVQITGFGTFKVRMRKARVGRNPQTKAEITIPARRSPAFTPGKKLRDAVA
jgi:nucleoid DNA-binding protein